jgi:hypothetical protein
MNLKEFKKKYFLENEKFLVRDICSILESMLNQRKSRKKKVKKYKHLSKCKNKFVSNFKKKIDLL